MWSGLRYFDEHQKVRRRPSSRAPRLPPLRPERTKLVTLKGTDVYESNARIISLIQGSSTGRKQSNKLPAIRARPPLVIEERLLPDPVDPILLHKPMYYTANLVPDKQIGDSHWRKRNIKVSMETERLIVEHLRNEVIKRNEERASAEPRRHRHHHHRHHRHNWQFHLQDDPFKIQIKETEDEEGNT